MTDPFLTRSRINQKAFFEKHHQLLDELIREGQTPEALFVGCSDSRVMPEQMLGALPGELFMLRNVANIVPPYIQTEIGIVSVLEFAVLHLHVPHIIICGHTQCEGIKSLDKHLDLVREPALSRWLDLARPAQREVDFNLRDLTPGERYRAIIERNVVHQLKHVQSYPFIRQALIHKQLKLHGWVYYLEENQIRYYDPASDEFR